MKLFIFHFRPIENYPPVQNFLLIAGQQFKGVECVSTKGAMVSLSFSGNIKVKRLGNISKGKLTLWWTYIWYNLVALFLLILRKPEQILYYESLSAFPAFVYLKYINPRAKLYIHYHEYTSPMEYIKASVVERFFHNLEKQIYPKVVWISHTNQIRLNQFLQDEQMLFQENRHFILPNFPSLKWAIKNRAWNESEPLRFIYVGYSLTAEGSYLSEIVEYLSQLAIKTTLSIYCLKPNEFIKQFELKDYNNLKVKIFDGLAYNELPIVLSQQHIGLILYKAKTPNYINNAPNKLFEYLNCGLDVWYPQEMLGIHEYKTDTNPKVVCINFNQMDRLNILELTERKKETRTFSYHAEAVYSKLLIALRKVS